MYIKKYMYWSGTAFLDEVIIMTFGNTSLSEILERNI